MTREYPTTSYVKVADQLKLIGVPATAKRRPELSEDLPLIWKNWRQGAPAPLESFSSLLLPRGGGRFDDASV